MTSHDLPHYIKLSGKPDDDVHSVMTQFRTLIAIISEDPTAPEIGNRRDLRYVDLFLTDAAFITKQQLETGGLERRSDSEPENPRASG